MRAAKALSPNDTEVQVDRVEHAIFGMSPRAWDTAVGRAAGSAVLQGLPARITDDIVLTRVAQSLLPSSKPDGGIGGGQ